jgi:hypothetical protein
MRAWRVTTAVKAFTYTPVDLSIKISANHPDPLYFQMLVIGTLISLATGIFLVNRILTERRKQTLKVDP